MTLRFAIVVFCASAISASHVHQGYGDAKLQADRAGIARFGEQATAATLSRDPIALTELWTDDAVRLRVGQPPELGRKAIQASNERWAAVPGIKIVSYVQETRDVTILDGWAVEWGVATGSYVEPSGESKQILGTRLMVLKKMPDGRWKCFRGMGGPTFTAPPPGQAVQVPATPAGSNTSFRSGDIAGIEKARQQDLTATIARDPVALTDLWTDDAVRLGPTPPGEVGKQTIRATNDRQTANKDFKVLSYVHESPDVAFLDGAWAVEWRQYAASFVTSPDGKPTQVRGMVLLVYKKMPDGSWKCFRGGGF